MEVGTAVAIFDKLIKFLGLVKAGEVERNQKVDEALNYFHLALVETQAYLRAPPIDGDKERERDISFLWYKASVPMRYVDTEISHICSVEGQYWSHPRFWHELRSGSLDISIENVEKLALELLDK
ncbi:MAG: hypothetical protein ACI85Z_000717 [Rheinheimera aquimaris]|jgi:hypothetical protein